MSRTFSPTGLRSLLKGETDEIWHSLLTIDHPSLAAPILVTDNGADVASLGRTFVPFPFDLRLVADHPKQPARGQLRIDNVDQRIMAAVRGLPSNPTIDLEVVLASDPDQREIGPVRMELKDVGYDATMITGTLGYRDVLSEPFPPRQFTPATTSGLFTQ